MAIAVNNVRSVGAIFNGAHGAGTFLQAQLDVNLDNTPCPVQPLIDQLASAGTQAAVVSLTDGGGSTLPSAVVLDATGQNLEFRLAADGTISNVPGGAINNLFITVVIRF